MEDAMRQVKFHWNLSLCLLTEQISYCLGDYFIIHSIGNIISVLLVWGECFMKRLHRLWNTLQVEAKPVYLKSDKKSFLQKGWCNTYLNFRRQTGRHPQVSRTIFWYHIEGFLLYTCYSGHKMLKKTKTKKQDLKTSVTSPSWHNTVETGLVLGKISLISLLNALSITLLITLRIYIHPRTWVQNSRQSHLVDSAYFPFVKGKYRILIKSGLINLWAFIKDK